MNIKNFEDELQDMADAITIMQDNLTSLKHSLTDRIAQLRGWRGVNPEVVKLEDKRKEK